MNPKQIEVPCPGCGLTLTIDVLTATVLRTARPTEKDETGKTVLDEGRWDEARSKVRDRTSHGQDVFDASLTKEKNRAKDLDDLFDKARKKVRPPPPADDEPT